MQCIFLLTAGAGNLLSNKNLLNPQEDISCKIAIAYSVVKMISVWQMTSFLARIPRQHYGRSVEHAQTKWVLVCLATVVVTAGVHWLSTSLEEKAFLLQRLYFGDKAGNVIGVLLEPFETIYDLHAAMVAYELYKSKINGMTELSLKP